MGRRTRLTFSVVLPAALLLSLAACGAPSATPAAAEAERLWEALAKDPSPELYKAFRDANREAARGHGEMHDRDGVTYQVRGLEAAAAQAARLRDPQESARLAFEVIDAVDEVERRDLLRVWDEVLPGAADRLRAARSAARPLVK